MIGDKHDTEATDFAWKGRVVGERRAQRRRGKAIEPGARTSENADMSNAKMR